MIYSIGDKFLLDGMLTEVLYVNCGKAWLGSVDGDDLKGVAIYTLDESGRDKNGNKAKAVSNDECLAV